MSVEKGREDMLNGQRLDRRPDLKTGDRVRTGEVEPGECPVHDYYPVPEASQAWACLNCGRVTRSYHEAETAERERRDLLDRRAGSGLPDDIPFPDVDEFAVSPTKGRKKLHRPHECGDDECEAECDSGRRDPNNDSNLRGDGWRRVSAGCYPGHTYHPCASCFPSWWACYGERAERASGVSWS